MTASKPTIVRLDPLVSSQIAAGEVVERPASVVKELVENSLDAGASRITVDFGDSGLSYIRVTDDGCGMSPQDAPLALERFATSKISSTNDLDRVMTLGFRGEALPSIASCSRVLLETRRKDDPTGVFFRSESGAITESGEKGLPVGTTLTVEDLFYNTPARLKFVRSKSSERQAIVDTVQRLALAWPRVAFALVSGNNTILRTSGQGLLNAVADIFGPDEAQSMIDLTTAAHKQESSPVRVEGLLGLPHLFRRQRDRQYISVNSRPARNSALAWALDDAFKGLVPPKTYPFAILNVVIPAPDLDVNVHPTKAEVRFRDDRAVRRAFSKAAKDALESAGFDLIAIPNDMGRSPSAHAPSAHAPFAQTPYQRSPRFVENTSGKVSWQLLRDHDILTKEAGKEITQPPLGWEYLGHVMDTYLIAKSPSSLLIVDKHALQESMIFKELVSQKGGSQDLLVAEILRLSPKEAVLFEEFQETLASLGFGCNLVGERTIMVTRVPLVLGEPMEPGTLIEALSRLSSPTGGPDRPSLLRLAQIETAACHASVRAREKLTEEEASALLARLAEDPSARTCPHGRPTVKEIPIREMDSFFGRTSQRK